MACLQHWEVVNRLSLDREWPPRRVSDQLDLGKDLDKAVGMSLGAKRKKRQCRKMDENSSESAKVHCSLPI